MENGQGHNTDAPLRLAVADGHPVICHGIARLAEPAEIVACTSGADRASLGELQGADVALVDPVTLGRPARELVVDAVHALPGTRILLFSHRLGPGPILESITAGGAGFLAKSADREQVAEGLATVARGDVLLDQATQTEIAHHLARREHPNALTRRERDVLRHAALGLNAAAIGAEMHISVTTVKTHLRAAYAKLGATNRAAAVAAALREGLLEDAPAAT